MASYNLLKGKSKICPTSSCSYDYVCQLIIKLSSKYNIARWPGVQGAVGLGFFLRSSHLRVSEDCDSLL